MAATFFQGPATFTPLYGTLPWFFRHAMNSKSVINQCCDACLGLLRRQTETSRFVGRGVMIVRVILDFFGFRAVNYR
jgi:hypothetical protein